MPENKGKGVVRMEAAVNLVDYLESMENQFSRMLSELREMQGTLSKIQDKGIRATVSRIVANAEGKWLEMQGQVSLIRENLIRSAQNAGTVGWRV